MVPTRTTLRATHVVPSGFVEKQVGADEERRDKYEDRNYWGQVVIVTIPERNIEKLPKNLFSGVPGSVVVVDTGNYYPRQRDGRIETIEAGTPVYAQDFNAARVREALARARNERTPEFTATSKSPGTFEALDSPSEWYCDASGTLYLWDPAGDNPALHDIEVKHREYGFDLTGVSDTTIQGIDLFACTIHTDAGSTNTTLNGLTAAYITQFTSPGGSGWYPPGPDGI